MAGHTPGPWKAVQPSRVVTPGERFRILLACTEGASPEEWEDNACLIAAAPELLEALKAIQDSIEMRGGDVPEWIQERMERGRAAIAKAEGRS